MRPVSHLPMPTMPQEEKKFFAELGARVAELRKGLGLTQQQFADALDTTRPPAKRGPAPKLQQQLNA